MYLTLFQRVCKQAKTHSLLLITSLLSLLPPSLVCTKTLPKYILFSWNHWLFYLSKLVNVYTVQLESTEERKKIKRKESLLYTLYNDGNVRRLQQWPRPTHIPFRHTHTSGSVCECAVWSTDARCQLQCCCWCCRWPLIQSWLLEDRLNHSMFHFALEMFPGMHINRLRLCKCRSGHQSVGEWVSQSVSGGGISGGIGCQAQLCQLIGGQPGPQLLPGLTPQLLLQRLIVGKGTGASGRTIFKVRPTGVCLWLGQRRVEDGLSAFACRLQHFQVCN